ncbi:MAG: sensor histidine kinase [Flavobacteriales bacterium]|nr:sensor histidine kinase [Flavobacteriales bacterium]
MKNLTPKGIALRISLFVATTVTIIVFFAEFFSESIHFLSLFLVFTSSLIISYFGFLIAIEQFIYKKIKLIYRLIHSLKLNKDDAMSDINLSKDIISQVSHEVIDWDKKNKMEFERLKDMESFRREFVGNVSHELKTPIFNIQGYLLTLMEGGLYDEKINMDYLAKANKSVERMIALIEDLDIISKLESGTIELDLKKINIVDLTQEILSSLEIKANDKNIKLGLHNTLNKPAWVMADADKITQVLVNLLVNSIKYGKEGGETTVRFYDMDENILIEVADNGQGIEEKHHKRLFERFYRTDRGRARDSGGTGLGLSIVKHIIEAHHQTINLRSTVDVGSTFSFTLKKAKQ